MNELRKLVFEKINFSKLKISKSDYEALVEKGTELGIEEAKVKKLVSTSLKSLKNFKEETLPMAILEEQDVSLEAEELCVPAEFLKNWRAEAEEKLKELEKVLASDSPEILQTFLIGYPELEAASKVPIAQFVKCLHKDIEMPAQETAPKPEPDPAPKPAPEQKAAVVEERTAQNQNIKPATNKKLPIFLIAGIAAGIAFITMIVVVIAVVVVSKPKVENLIDKAVQDQTIIEALDKQVDALGKQVDAFDKQVYQAASSEKNNDIKPVETTNESRNEALVSSKMLRRLRSVKMSSREFSGYSKAELRILRNAIFAAHGYMFKSDDLRAYFAEFDWYNPAYKDVSAKLSSIEKKNIATIKALEDSWDSDR